MMLNIPFLVCENDTRSNPILIEERARSIHEIFPMHKLRHVKNDA